MTRNHQLSKMILVLILSIAICMTFSPKADAVSNGGDPYLGQISLFPYYFTPSGWAKCNGVALNRTQYPALYSLLGTRFGNGDGTTTFNIPNLTDASPLNDAAYFISLEGYYPQSDGSYDGILGEIGIFPYNFTPGGWAPCNGATLAINTNPALYSLLGTMFGGNGTSTFCLPDLRDCAPISGLQYCISVSGVIPSGGYGNQGDYENLLGEIDLFPNNSIATGDSSGNCNGQLINNNDALYSLIGTTFGGSGSSNFALPDLRGAVPDGKLRYFIQLSGFYPMHS